MLNKLWHFPSWFFTVDSRYLLNAAICNKVLLSKYQLENCFNIAPISLSTFQAILFGRNLFVPLFWDGGILNLKGAMWGICCEFICSIILGGARESQFKGNYVGNLL